MVAPVLVALAVALTGSFVAHVLHAGAAAAWAVLVLAGVAGTLLMARDAVLHAPRRYRRPAPGSKVDTD